jgi:hypothetical protein
MAKLTREDWEEINDLERRMGKIFSESDPLPAYSGKAAFEIPACCFPGCEGYDDIIAMRRQIKQIKDGRKP